MLLTVPRHTTEQHATPLIVAFLNRHFFRHSSRVNQRPYLLQTPPLPPKNTHTHTETHTASGLGSVAPVPSVHGRRRCAKQPRMSALWRPWRTQTAFPQTSLRGLFHLQHLRRGSLRSTSPLVKCRERERRLSFNREPLKKRKEGRRKEGKNSKYSFSSLITHLN